MSNLQHSLGSDPFFCDSTPEIRSMEGGGEKIFGYWAVFNRMSREMLTKKGVKFVEQILPGAFDNTDFSDLESRFNHADYLSSAPSLRYGVDDQGAWFEYDHDPQDPAHQAVYRRIQRREIKGSSFQFPPLPADCFTVTDLAGVKLRTISKFPRVLEVGPVITPAYPASSAFARSLDQSQQQEDEVIQQQPEPVSTEQADLLAQRIQQFQKVISQ
jgi:HK97 family phage prohead protease